MVHYGCYMLRFSQMLHADFMLYQGPRDCYKADCMPCFCH